MDRDSWETVSRRVFWDRCVSLPQWRNQVAAGHRSYLPDSLVGMTPAEFVWFYGLSRFQKDWPSLRAALPAERLWQAGRFDVAWSQSVGGGWNLRPTPDFWTMPTKRRAFLIQVAKTPGISIYAAAKALGLQYRRAHDHAVSLQASGTIRARLVIEKGHHKRQLFPAYPAHSCPGIPPLPKPP